MSNIYTSLEQLIGHTPLLELTHLEQEYGLKARLLAKLESFNPGGSSKDRIAAAMLDDLQTRGLLNKNSVIIEPTSGNTGIGLCTVAAARGYSIIIVMPENASMERRKIMAALGAQLVLTPAKGGMSAAIEKANELAKTTPGAVVTGQFVNPANPLAHYQTTGPEIWADTDGQVDWFVAGVGTGGTMTGTGRYLKEQNPDVRVAAIEPAGSAVLSGGTPGAHMLQGLGAGFVPDTLDVSVFDELFAVSDDAALSTARLLAKKEGVLSGISAGGALWAGLQIAKRPESAGKTIVVLLPDTGERYLSTPLFDL